MKYITHEEFILLSKHCKEFKQIRQNVWRIDGQEYCVTLYKNKGVED